MGASATSPSGSRSAPSSPMGAQVSPSFAGSLQVVQTPGQRRARTNRRRVEADQGPLVQAMQTSRDEEQKEKARSAPAAPAPAAEASSPAEEDQQAASIVQQHRGHCAGLVNCQYRGKGKFREVWLSLAPGTSGLTFREASRDGKVLRTAEVAGCRVSTAMSARKDRKTAFRVDLASKDSKGDTRYVVSVDTMEEFFHWKSSLSSYSDEVVAIQAKIDKAARTKKDAKAKEEEARRAQAAKKKEEEEAAAAAAKAKAKADEAAAAAATAATQEEEAAARARADAAAEQAKQKQEAEAAVARESPARDSHAEVSILQPRELFCLLASFLRFPIREMVLMVNGFAQELVRGLQSEHVDAQMEIVKLKVTKNMQEEESEWQKQQEEEARKKKEERKKRKAEERRKAEEENERKKQEREKKKGGAAAEKQRKKPKAAAHDESLITSVFEAAGPIGITWVRHAKDGDGGQEKALVSAFKPGGQAESAKELRIGLVLMSVNGTRTAGRGYAEQIKMIRDSGRPITLRFREPTQKEMHYVEAKAKQQANASKEGPVAAPPCAGTLLVEVVDCSKVLPADRGGKSDPFVVATFDGATRKTSCKAKTLKCASCLFNNPHQCASTFTSCLRVHSPVFQQVLEFPVQTAEAKRKSKRAWRELRLELWDRDRGARNDFLGQVVVDLGLAFGEKPRGWESSTPVPLRKAFSDPEERLSKDVRRALTQRMEMEKGNDTP